jgi:hypothetical protein
MHREAEGDKSVTALSLLLERGEESALFTQIGNANRQFSQVFQP